MAGRDLGEGSRLAAATGAYVCFEDEAGQNLRPPKARTWAPRGRTPVVTVSGKGSGRVSVAGLVCLKPGARGHLFYRVRVHRGRKGERRSMSEADYAGLITAAHQQLQAPVILIWDRLNTHVSAVMRAFISSHPVGFQNSATGLDLGFYAARSYSLTRPPRTGRRFIRS